MNMKKTNQMLKALQEEAKEFWHNLAAEVSQT